MQRRFLQQSTCAGNGSSVHAWLSAILARSQHFYVFDHSASDEASAQASHSNEREFFQSSVLYGTSRSTSRWPVNVEETMASPSFNQGSDAPGGRRRTSTAGSSSGIEAGQNRPRAN